MITFSGVVGVEVADLLKEQVVGTLGHGAEVGRAGAWLGLRGGKGNGGSLGGALDLGEIDGSGGGNGDSRGEEDSKGLHVGKSVKDVRVE